MNRIEFIPYNAQFVRFYPYESVHAKPVIKVETSTHSWALTRLLEEYEPDTFFNCSPGYFNLRPDNKITLEFLITDECMNNSSLFVTIWDGVMSIGTEMNRISSMPSSGPKHCTVRHKDI